MSKGLMPCPICGAHAELLAAEIRETHDAMVECTQCGTTGPTTKTSAEAVAAWNTRAADAEVAGLRAEVERLREALAFYAAPWGPAVLMDLSLTNRTWTTETSCWTYRVTVTEPGYAIPEQSPLLDWGRKARAALAEEEKADAR